MSSIPTSSMESLPQMEDDDDNDNDDDEDIVEDNVLSSSSYPHARDHNSEEEEDDSEEKQDDDDDDEEEDDIDELHQDTSEDEISEEMSKLALGAAAAGPVVGDGEEDDDDDDGSPTLKTIARWMKEGACRNILVLSGAGVSCSAGIPDFRTPGTGLYDNLQKYNLPYPQAVFDLSFYRLNPHPFLALANEIWPGEKHSPTITHSFIKLLETKHFLLRNYTQNIDGLEVLAGVSPDHMVECHGHFRSASCIDCRLPFLPSDRCHDDILTRRIVPKCDACGGLVKPDIVFFGEGLPSKFGKLVMRDLACCDLLIVMGTSLTVAPVSLIPGMAPRSTPRLLLNNELVGDFMPRMEGNCRDVFVAGDCDESVRKLCQLLGWEEELDELNASTRITNTTHHNSNEESDDDTSNEGETDNSDNDESDDNDDDD